MFPIINYGQHTDQINSNRPGETMSAFAVGKSVIQLETGIYGIKENHSLLEYDARVWIRPYITLRCITRD
jgi:hypothetical protein